MEPVTTWAAPQNVSFILSRIPRGTKVKPRLVRRDSADRFRLDAEEADHYRCVPRSSGSVGLLRLDAADHAAPRLLSRRQHLLGLGAKPGHGRWISHREF